MTFPLQTIPLVILSLAFVSLEASAQSNYVRPNPRRHLQDHTIPPGQAGYWAGALGRVNPAFFQRVKIQVEGGANIEFFGNGQQGGIKFPSPAQAGVQVGHVYRLKISDIPDMPGVTVYPTIELMDRLHPPEGQEEKFPIPIEITLEEIRFALNDQLVTKVIYLEQPQLANSTIAKDEELRTDTLPHSHNLIAEADRRGRPLLFFRLGSRIPDPQNPNAMFGTRGSIQTPQQIPAQTNYSIR